MKDKEPSFSLNDFRKWMDRQGEEIERKPGLLGALVESKVSIKKILSRMDPEDGELYQMAKEFYRQGGKILDVDESLVLIEVTSGTFMIPKSYVRRY